MAAYVVALIQSISDAEAYKRYVAQVEATLAPHGGRFLARRPDPEALEGADVPSRAVILEFPSVDAARAWHASDPYQPVMRLRQSASRGTLLLLPSYGEPRVHEGDVHYVEVVTPDPQGAARILRDVHGWRFDAADAQLGGALVATLPNGARCGIRAPMDGRERPLTRAYVRVRDAAEAAARAGKMGATVALAPTTIPGHGTIAIWIHGGVEHGVWQLP